MILFGFVFLNMLNKPILQCITTTPTILIPQPLPKPYATSDSEPPPRPLLKFGALAGSGTQEAAYSFRVYMIAGGGLARRDSRGNETPYHIHAVMHLQRPMLDTKGPYNIAAHIDPP